MLPIITMPRTRRLSIVENVKPADNILETRYNLQTFTVLLESGTLEFCARWGLIANSKMCIPPCVGQMSLQKDTSKSDGYRVSISAVTVVYEKLAKYFKISGNATNVLVL